MAAILSAMSPNAYFVLVTVANCAAAVSLWSAIYRGRRFSLASLFVLTLLFAVALGVAVWRCRS